MIKEIKSLEQLDIYKLVSNIVVPRPIAWVSTKSKENILNLAPFSYFIPLSSKPATLLISIGHKKDGSPKDTLKNLRDTKKCSIVIASPSDVKDVEVSATPLDYNSSEFENFNIKTKEMLPNYPAIPKSAKAAFFAKYLKEVELEGSKTVPVIVEIEAIYIDDTIYNNGKIKIDPLARVGAKYFSLGDELEKN